MNRFSKSATFVALFLFISTILSNPLLPASANSLDKCRIATSKNSNVSLGFPVANERLRGNPKILVIPFKLKDTPYVFTDKDKEAAIEGAKIIQKISGNQSNPSIVFGPLMELDSVKEDIVQLKVNQQNGWQKRDETKSTWGFIRKVIDEADVSIDYSGIDAVIVQGPTSTDQEWLNKGSIGEAMMFSKDPGDPFFRPLKTAEKTIYNASLITGTSLGNATTYAHEIMHLYGLTDLYGGSSSPTFSSLMAGQNHRLLAYEKWILGWLADSQITCLDGTDNGTIKKQVTEIKFNNDASEQVVVISQSNVRDAIIIEKANIFNQVTQGVDSYLAFYSLKNDERPPIFMYPIAGVGQNFMTHYNGVASTRYISNVVKSDDYQLLISNVDQLGVTLHLVPKSESDKLTALQASARNIQAEAEAKVLADIQAKEKAAADAEAKAKADAEAKAKADAEAKSRVQSSTKIAVKPKTITCVKGKVSKKITASKPKCPAGFKQR